MRSNPIDAKTKIFERGTYPYKLGDVVINGDIPPHVMISVENGSLTINGNVGPGCHIDASGAVHALNIDQTAEVHGISIDVQNVGQAASLTSRGGNVFIRGDIEDYAEVNSARNIILKGKRGENVTLDYKGKLYHYENDFHIKEEVAASLVAPKKPAFNDRPQGNVEYGMGIRFNQSTGVFHVPNAVRDMPGFYESLAKCKRIGATISLVDNAGQPISDAKFENPYLAYNLCITAGEGKSRVTNAREDEIHRTLERFTDRIAGAQR